jgi:hypothetical protein
MASLTVLCASAQIVNEDELRKVELPANGGIISCITALPDGHSVLVGYTQGAPLCIVDTTTWSVTRTIPLAGWADGPRLEVSRDGRIVHAFAMPRMADGRKDDPTVEHAVLELATGRTLLTFKAKDASLSADGTVIAKLDGNEVHVLRVADAGVVRTITVTDATNAVALSPDGSTIAVAHRTTEALLATVPSVRNDKKAIKPALKYRQMVSFFSAQDGVLIGSVPEVYDIIRALAFTRDGSRLLVYSSTDPRAQGAGAGALSFNGAARPGRVEQVDAHDRMPLRASFWSRMNEPFLAISPDGATIALSSTGGKNGRQLTLYDFASADTRYMIDLAQKHKYDVSEGEEHDGRLAYAWLSDGRLILALGSNLGIHTP